MNSKFRGSTIQADKNLRRYSHDGLVNIFQSEKMDAHLRPEFRERAESAGAALSLASADNAQTESVVVIKIVARASAKRAKTEQIQKTEIIVIFRLEEGFS